MKRIEKCTIDDESKKTEIQRLTQCETDNFELNGKKFIRFNDEISVEKSDVDNKKMLEYIFERKNEDSALRSVILVNDLGSCLTEII